MIFRLQVNRHWNGFGMAKKRLKKGEGQKIVLGAIDEWKTRKEIENETKLKYTTIDEALKALKSTKVEKREFINSDGKTILKFRNKKPKDAIDSNDLKFIMDNYRSNNCSKQAMAFEDIKSICGLRRIVDKEFIEFLIEQCSINPLMWDCLGRIAERLYFDMNHYTEEDSKEKELLKLIQCKTGEYFKKMFLTPSNITTHIDQSIFNDYPPLIRREALKTLSSMCHPSAYEVVFQFLKTANTKKFYEIPTWRYVKSFAGALYPKWEKEVLKKRDDKDTQEFTEFDLLKFDLKDIILDYAKLNFIDCKKWLYEIFDVQKDKKIKEWILKLSANLTKDRVEDTTLPYFFNNNSFISNI